MKRIKKLIWIIKRVFVSKHYFIYSKKGMQFHNFPKEDIDKLIMVLKSIKEKETNKILDI